MEMLETLDPVYRAEQDKHAELCTSIKVSLERCFSGPA